MPFHGIFRFRYTLRALLVFITLFGLYVGYHGNRAFKERRAEAVLLRAGAQFKHSWLPTVFPYRIIIDVDQVRTVKPDVVQALVDLPYLKSLRILAPDVWDSAGPGDSGMAMAPRADMPDGALEKVLRQRRLYQLSLDGWRLSDSDCLAISRQQNLEKLTLVGGEFSEESFAMLLSTPKLRVLRCDLYRYESQHLVQHQQSENTN